MCPPPAWMCAKEPPTVLGSVGGSVTSDVHRTVIGFGMAAELGAWVSKARMAEWAGWPHSYG
jgi:hypothetical protein